MRKFSFLCFYILCISFVYAGNINTLHYVTQVNAEMISSCKISAININFGLFLPGNQQRYINSNGNIKTICSNNLPYSISLSLGNLTYYPSYGTIENGRTLISDNANNVDYVRYNIFIDSSRTKIFGDANASNSYTLELVGSGDEQNTILYGKLNKNNFVTPSIYSDSLQIKLTF